MITAARHSRPQVPPLVVASARVSAPPYNRDEAQPWPDRDGVARAFAYVRDGKHWVDVPALGHFSFGDDAVAVTVIPREDARQDAVIDYYHRVILPVVLHGRGWEVLHASGVVTDRGVVAFSADSQTGKSTIAYGLSRRGYPLYADDTIPFTIADQVVETLPAPFYVRLRSPSAAFFGVDSGQRIATGQYAVTPLQSHNESVPLAAVCILERGDSLDRGLAVEFDRPAPAEALFRLQAQAYYNLENDEREREMIRRYLDLIGRVRIVRVRFRSGLDHVPALLDGIERAVIGGEPLHGT